MSELVTLQWNAGAVYYWFSGEALAKRFKNLSRTVRQRLQTASDRDREISDKGDVHCAVVKTKCLMNRLGSMYSMKTGILRTNAQTFSSKFLTTSRLCTSTPS